MDDLGENVVKFTKRGKKVLVLDTTDLCCLSRHRRVISGIVGVRVLSKVIYLSDTVRILINKSGVTFSNIAPTQTMRLDGEGWTSLRKKLRYFLRRIPSGEIYSSSMAMEEFE